MASNKSSKHLSKLIAKLMLEKKAEDIKIIRVEKITTLTDYFVICSSGSDPQTKAIRDNIEMSLRKKGVKAYNREGLEKSLDWVLIDYFDVVAQIFSKKARNYYDIERLWADGEIIEVLES
tara:strand:+ start:18 stop:380 length:363 start_codon:yes stop_codon:yes gene_type:complete